MEMWHWLAIITNRGVEERFALQLLLHGTLLDRDGGGEADPLGGDRLHR